MEPFRAWFLPDPSAAGAGVEEVPVRDGVSLAHPAPETVDMEALREGLLRAREAALLRTPVDDLAVTLGTVGARFGTPGDPLREEALNLLPHHAGLSEPMAREVLDGMAADWTVQRLRRLLKAEFPDPRVLDGFIPGPEARLHAAGSPLLVQISAGNVPGVSVGSLLRAILVKSAVLLKPARTDAILPVLFAQGLKEEAPDLAAAVAVLYWPGGDSPVERRAVAAADRVVAYGGLDTIRTLRGTLAPTTPLVAYPHRVSFGAVTRQALDADAGGVARKAARAVALFDQRGCVSPQLLYVEEGAALTPLAFAETLADALEAEARRIPPGPLSTDEAAQARQVRETEELREAAGLGVHVSGPGVGRGTVIHDPDPAFVASCLARTVRLKPLADLEGLGPLLEPVRPYLQSVGLESTRERRPVLAEGLARWGVPRVTDLTELPWPPPWWHHDGGGPLRDLVDWRELSFQD